jgi:hypothetical protein
MNLLDDLSDAGSGGELLVPQVLRGFPQVFAVAPAVNHHAREKVRHALADDVRPRLQSLVM